MTFDEPVDVSGGWYDIKCPSGSHTAVVSGGPLTYTLDPNADFAYDESLHVHGLSAERHRPGHQRSARHSGGDHVATFQTVAAPPKPPTVDAGGPYAVVQGDSVVVSATGSQPDGQTLTYRWDLDDNGTFETPGQSVTFSAAGLPAPSTRTIAVRATAPTGLTATDEATVNVSAIDDDFAFDGFRGLKNLPDVNESNLGTQFIRFSLGGNQGLDIFKNDHPMSASYPCGSTPPSDRRASPRDSRARAVSGTTRGPTSTPSSGTSTSRGRAPAGCSSSGSATDPRTTWRSASVPLQQRLTETQVAARTAVSAAVRGWRPDASPSD